MGGVLEMNRALDITIYFPQPHLICGRINAFLELVRGKNHCCHDMKQGPSHTSEPLSANASAQISKAVYTHTHPTHRVTRRLQALTSTTRDTMKLELSMMTMQTLHSTGVQSSWWEMMKQLV